MADNPAVARYRPGALLSFKDIGAYVQEWQGAVQLVPCLSGVKFLVCPYDQAQAITGLSYNRGLERELL